LPAAGGESQKIAGYDGSINAYAVSPDGKWVAFAGVMAHPIQSYTKTDLFVVSATPGSQPRDLTKSYIGEILGGVGGDQAPPRAGRGPRPEWSADGKKIYVVTGDEGTANLKSIDVATGRDVTDTTGTHVLRACTQYS